MSHRQSPPHAEETSKNSLQKYNKSKQKNKQHRRKETIYNEDSSKADSLDYSSSDSNTARGLCPSTTIRNSTDIDSSKATAREKIRKEAYTNERDKID
jgi:hypothetical protein